MRRRKKHIWKEVCRSQMGKPVSISYYCRTCTWLPSSDGLFYWTPYLLPWRLRWRVWHTSKWNPYWMKHVPAATAAAAAVTALRLRNWLAGSPLMSALFTHRYMCVCNRYDRQMSLCDSRGESRWWIAHSFVDIAFVVVWYVRSSGCANVFKVSFLVIVARSWFNRREGADELTDERTGWEAGG